MSREAADRQGGSKPNRDKEVPHALSRSESRTSINTFILLMQSAQANRKLEWCDNPDRMRQTHVSRLLTKLYARDRAQLVMLAYEAGVVVPGSG